MGGMPDHHFPSLDDLIRDIERETATRPELPEVLTTVIRMMVASDDADPYLLVGVLTEGVSHAIASRIPKEDQSEVAGEALSLLRERLQANGLL